MSDPALTQYKHWKKQYPDVLVAVPVGSFWEFYNEDAEAVSKATGMSLLDSKRWGESVQVTGFPKNAGDSYVPRLIDAGHKVGLLHGPDVNPGGIMVARGWSIER